MNMTDILDIFQAVVPYLKYLEEIVNSKKLREIIKTYFARPSKIDECRECRWRNFCGAGCMGNAFEANGTIWSPDSCNVRKQWIEKLFQAKFNEIYRLEDKREYKCSDT